MGGYTPLFSSITTSTVWLEDDSTLRVWITMLATKDKDGIVNASIPGLAATARVSLEKCERALNKFLSPDPYSRTKECEGRRIQEIAGGWLVLNHNIYKDKVKSRAEYYRTRRAQRSATQRNSGATVAQHSRHTAQHEITPPTPTTPPTTPPAIDSLEKKNAKKAPLLSPSLSPTSKTRKPPKQADVAKAVTDLPIPESLDTVSFRKVWLEWQDERATIKHPLSIRGAKSQLTALALVGEHAAIKTIQASISAGYQGLFPPKLPPGVREKAAQGAHDQNESETPDDIDPNWKGDEPLEF